MTSASNHPSFPSARERPRGFSLAHLPGEFGSWRDEARACRSNAALFDFSCLVTIEVRGPDSVRLLEAFCSRRLGDMQIGAIRYALTADDEGRLVSDVTIWRTGSEEFLIMTGRPEDLSTLRIFAENICGTRSRTEINDRWETTCVLALQGPAVAKSLLSEFGLSLPGRFRFVRSRLLGADCLIAGLGYTGEDGVELLCAPDAAAKLWSACVSLARPAGFQAADLLRLEAGLALFSRDFAPGVSAAEAGLAAIRSDTGGAVPELARIRAFARPLAPDGPMLFAPSRVRPKAGQLAITSAALCADDSDALVMGYVRVEDIMKAPLHDPAGNFQNLRPIYAKGVSGLSSRRSPALS